jgi:hypothetical protein
MCIYTWNRMSENSLKTLSRTARIKAARELTSIFDSKLFKALCEPVRVEIMRFLTVEGRSDVCTIAGHFPQEPPSCRAIWPFCTGRGSSGGTRKAATSSSRWTALALPVAWRRSSLDSARSCPCAVPGVKSDRHAED